MKGLGKALKAVYAAAITGFSTTGAAYAAGGHTIGLTSACIIATAVITAFGGVYGVTNAPVTD